MGTFVNTDFIFDGINSSDMYNLKIVKLETGLFEQTFGMPRSTIKDFIKNRKKPYFYKLREDVLKLNIQIAKDTEWTNQEKYDVLKWLSQETYKDFISTDQNDIVYKCILVGEPKFYNNGNNEGYAELEFECDAPHAYTQQTVQTFDLSDNTTTTTIEVENKSNIDDYYYPEVEVALQGTSTSFILTNLSDGGRQFEFTSLTSGETIYINNESGTIISDLDLNRLPNLTDKKFFRLVYGVNQIQVTGEMILKIRYQYPIIV